MHNKIGRKLDKVLFRNNFLAVIDRDDYIFSREVRCDGIIVSLLPFRPTGIFWEFLARLEVCPAHSHEQKLYSITGGAEPQKTIQATAQQELLEEAGYQAQLNEFISLGKVYPTKSSDTIVYLFAINVDNKFQSTPQGDGSKFEVGASVQWVNYDQGIEIEDPLFITTMTRLLHFLQGKNDGIARD